MTLSTTNFHRIAWSWPPSAHCSQLESLLFLTTNSINCWKILCLIYIAIELMFVSVIIYCIQIHLQMLLCSFSASILNINPKINTLSTGGRGGNRLNKWMILCIIKSPRPQMDSTNVQIHLSRLAWDKSKYSAQWNRKGSSKKSSSSFSKVWAKPCNAMAYG